MLDFFVWAGEAFIILMLTIFICGLGLGFHWNSKPTQHNETRGHYGIYSGRRRR